MTLLEVLLTLTTIFDVEPRESMSARYEVTSQNKLQSHGQLYIRNRKDDRQLAVTWCVRDTSICLFHSIDFISNEVVNILHTGKRSSYKAKTPFWGQNHLATKLGKDYASTASTHTENGIKYTLRTYQSKHLERVLRVWIQKSDCVRFEYRSKTKGQADHFFRIDLTQIKHDDIADELLNGEKFLKELK